MQTLMAASLMILYDPDTNTAARAAFERGLMARGKREIKHKALRFESRQFKPYATAIGQFVLAWNDLHETLAVLYWTLVDFDDKVLDRWNEAKFDHKKRALITRWSKGTSDKSKALMPHLYDDLDWLIGQIDLLAEPRNDTAHSPLTIVNDTFFIRPKPFKIAPNTTWGNYRAKRLLGKKLLTEFRQHRKTASKLADFAVNIERSLTDEHTPWPKRPCLSLKN